MTTAYKTVIGLEVHVQLLTRTKLFCGCSTKFGLPPNSATCPVCLGLPGSLPVMNRRAFDLGIRAALALNCSINKFTKWDRKNYYYPDLPKNYQISQYDLPFSYEGWLEINVAADPKKDYVPKRVGIIRAHLEEDAGKNMHDESGRGGDSKVDLNRTGTPLVEIVSKPEMSSPAEAVAYLTELRLLLRELGVSDCEMQEGSLRCDANVNVHIPQADGTVAATPLVEVKNLNSFRAVERAIAYEAQRQYEEFQKTGQRFGDVAKATAGWDDARGQTRIQRRKEEASDYRYFPEPDLVPVTVDDAYLEEARAALGELPIAQRARLKSDFGLSVYDADVLVRQGRASVTYFEAVAAGSGDAKAAVNWIANKLLQTDGAMEKIPAERLVGLLREQKSRGLTKQIAEQVFDSMLADGEDAATVIGKLGITAVDELTLVDIIRKAIEANPKAVEDYKKGKVAAAQRIKGAVMKETKGAVKPDTVDAMLATELAKL
ncbi:MAG: Asp-tRNA(Asn)/Glu-tRNA(Gln) amidotransferase subunit GatB [Gemmataceae bacterium]|nr:Asp-tRNA(Asn)/Glu-tRNA(Gln) amidotransferase subunit GatB [Gemmataceae bacterium]